VSNLPTSFRVVSAVKYAKGRKSYIIGDQLHKKKKYIAFSIFHKIGLLLELLPMCGSSLVWKRNWK